MIIKKDNKDKYNSRFMCDRCRTELAGNERITIFVEDHKRDIKKKKWDFCATCYRLLKKGVERRTNENT